MAARRPSVFKTTLPCTSPREEGRMTCVTDKKAECSSVSDRPALRNLQRRYNTYDVVRRESAYSPPQLLREPPEAIPLPHGDLPLTPLAVEVVAFCLMLASREYPEVGEEGVDLERERTASPPLFMPHRLARLRSRPSCSIAHLVPPLESCGYAMVLLITEDSSRQLSC